MDLSNTIPTTTTRECGSCEECCFVAEVKEGIIQKNACQKCPFQQNGCKIFGKPERPKVCIDFQCGWLRGAGTEEDRPDKSGIMVSVNKIEDSTWIVAMDLKKNAHRTTGKNIVIDMLNKYKLPVIVVDHDNLEKGKGDYVIIHDSMLPRAGQLIGNFLNDISINMKEYELIIH